MANARLNDRQAWLLIFLLTRHPLGVAENTRVPHRAVLNGREYGSPGALGMVNLRGLQRRGYVHENENHIFYLTEEGVLAAYKAAEDSRWSEVLCG